MDRDEKIVQMFLDGATFAVISKEVGISRERVRQILRKLIGSAVDDVKKIRAEERATAIAEREAKRRAEVAERKKPETRFWKKVKKTDGCWYWTGAVCSVGYGKMHLNGGSGQIYAHRFSYHLHHGALPNGTEVDHICNETLCVNPNHLRAVTASENCKRRRQTGPRKTHCIRGHAFETYGKYYSGVRVCSECARIRHRVGFVSSFDKKKCKYGHPRNKANTYITPMGRKQCLVCQRERFKTYQRDRLKQALDRRAKIR